MNAARTPTEQDAAFLAAICADPEDIVSRLVYADWLMERDDPRGEFIHCQIKLGLDGSGLPHWPTRFYHFREEWEPQIPGLRSKDAVRRANATVVGCCSRHADNMACDCLATAAEFTFRRGFVEVVTCSLLTWWRHGRRIVRLCPVTKVEITDRVPRDNRERTLKGFFHQHFIDERTSNTVIPTCIWVLMPNLEPRGRARSTANLNVASLRWARGTEPG